MTRLDRGDTWCSDASPNPNDFTLATTGVGQNSSPRFRFENDRPEQHDLV